MGSTLASVQKSPPQRGLPEFARVYKGMSKEAFAKTGKRGRPPELDYLRVEWNPVYAHLREPFEALYGAAPKSLPWVYFPYQRAEDAFMTRMEKWGETTLKLACDGENVLKVFDATEGRVVTAKDMVCENTAPQTEAPTCGCKATGRLSFVLPQFSQRVSLPGTFLLVTHGWTDIYQIAGALRSVEAMTGSCMGTWFTLARVPQEIEFREYDEKEKKYKVRRTTKHMCELHVQHMGATIELPSGAAPDLPNTFSGAALLGDGSSSGDDKDSGDVQPFAVEKSALDFVDLVHADYPDMTPREMAKLLGVVRFSEYRGSITKALDTIRAAVNGE